MTGPQDNAMTEIALALAMAFFSIMVLTMVSMGTGVSAAAKTAETVEVNPDRLVVRPSDPGGTPPPSRSAVPRESLVIHWQGSFLDAGLKGVDPATLNAPLVLAVAPDLPLSEAARVRKRLGAAEVTVTTLDPHWITALRRMER